MTNDTGQQKLKSEVDKLRAEAEALRRAPHAIWTNWIPLLGGLAALCTALIGGLIQWRVTDLTIERNQIAADRKVIEAERKVLEAEKKTDIVEKQAADLLAKKIALDSEIAAKAALLAAAERDLRLRQSELAKAAAATSDPTARQTLSAAAADTGAIAADIARRNKLVYLQFRGDIERATVEALRAEFTRAGYSAPGVQRVGGEYRSEVRYFNPDDEVSAKDVASIVSVFLKEQCGLPVPVEARLRSWSKPVQHLEVWLSAKCPT